MFKPHVRICLTAFLLDFSVMAGMTAMPFFVINQLGGDTRMVGLFGAMPAVVYAGVCLLSLRFLSGMKNGLRLALAGAVIFCLSYCLVPVLRVPWICCTFATVGIGSLALVWPALHSWVGSEPDPHVRARHMSHFNISWTMGFACSPLLAGPLYDLDYRYPFVLLFLMSVGVIALILSLPREKDHFAAATADVLTTRAAHDRASEAYLYAAWCATFVANVFVSVSRSVYADRVTDLVNAGQLRLFFESEPSGLLLSGIATKFSWLSAGLSITTAATFVLLGRWSGWHHSFKPLLALQCACAAAFWTLGHTCSLAVMLLCYVVIGANVGISFFSSVYYGMADPVLKHRRAAVNECVVGFGGFMGALVFGHLAAQYGMAFPFHYTPVFVAVALVVQMALLRYGSLRAARKEA